METIFDISEIADFMSALKNHNQLLDTLLSLATKDKEQNEKCKMFFKKLLHEKGYITPSSYERFGDIEFHIIKQMWSSTSCGWGGIGGSAMTESYTIIIENKSEKFSSIYYSGRLVYVVEVDEKYDAIVKKNYYTMPGADDVKKVLTVLYKPDNKY